MTQCRECGKQIIGTVRKEFCDDYCRGAYHRRRYRQQKIEIAAEEAEDRRQARMNGHGTAEERQQAREVLSRIVQEQQPRFVRRV
jgi:DnaJ-class molecular chaperone